MVFGNSAINKVVVEQVEQQKRLAASAYSGYNFYQSVFLSGNNLIKITVPFNYHITPPILHF